MLETHAAPVAADAAPAAPAAPVLIDPAHRDREPTPKGALSAVAEKVEYWTQGRAKAPVPGGVLPARARTPTALATVDRAIEFFMPVGQSSESQQWMTSSMRLLSLTARGGFLERAPSDMRKVVWDRGPRAPGCPPEGRWHPGADVARLEVAAVAYAIQNILERRAECAARAAAALPQAATSAPSPATPPVMAGKKCSECGAHAVIRKDGCDYCTQCVPPGHLRQSAKGWRHDRHRFALVLAPCRGF